MEIKVGEYIRTKKGNIGKVLDITTCTGQKRKKYLIKWNIDKAYYITGTTIVKHGPNIIDIIEEGDYVNGKCVYSFGTVIGNLPIINNTDGTFTPNTDIETIFTHEQMEEMEYKL